MKALPSPGAHNWHTALNAVLAELQALGAPALQATDELVSELFTDPESLIAQGIDGILDPWTMRLFDAPADAADVPVLTIANASQIAGGTTLAPTTDYYGDARFRYDGMTTLEAVAGSKVRPPVSALGLSYYIGVTTVLSSMSACEFKYDTTSAGTALTARVIVDGKWIGTYGIPFAALAGNTSYWIKATFGDAKPRRVRFEVANAANFGGVVVPAGGSAARPGGDVWRLTALGDSYVAGSGGNTSADPADNGTTRIETFPRYLAAQLRCTSYVNLGVGGTGWVYDGGGGKSTYGQRIGEVLSTNPQIVLIAGSINDVHESLNGGAGATFAQVYSAVSAALTQLVNVPVVILTGPERDSSLNAGYVTYNDAIARAAAAHGRIFVDTIDTIGVGDYNAIDNTHPSALKHRFKLAPKMYAGIDHEAVMVAVAAAMGGRASVDLTVSVSPAGAAATGANVTLTATQPFLRTGAVDFYDAGVKIGSAAIVAGAGTTGVATLVTNTLADGQHNLQAIYRPAAPGLVKTAVSAYVSYNVSANLGIAATFATDGPDLNTDNGKPWTSSGSGAWVNSGGNLTNPTAVANSYHHADVGSPNFTHTVTIAAGSTGGTGLGVRILFRTVDGGNTLQLITSSGQIQLARTETNVTTPIATGTGGTWVATDVIDVIPTSANTVTVKKNGVNVTGLVNVDVSAYAFNSATRAGVGITSSGAGAKFASVNTVAA